MSNILQIGFTTEGTTDIRFLENIIRKSFEYAVLNCKSQIEVYPPEHLKKEGNGIVEQVVNMIKKYPFFHVICVHRDADSPSKEDVLNNSINPAFRAVMELEENVCKNLVAVIPVQMTEAWMLSNIDLLKEKIGTSKPNNELGLPNRLKAIETLSDPKSTINEAIRIAQINQSKRRKKLTISQLYSPLSQELLVDDLLKLPSYAEFIEDINNSLGKLNYL